MTAECLGETCKELTRSKKIRLTKTTKKIIYREIPQLEVDDFKEVGAVIQIPQFFLPPLTHLASPLPPHSNKYNEGKSLTQRYQLEKIWKNSQATEQLLS